MQYKNGFKIPKVSEMTQESEEEKAETETLNFDKPQFEFIPKGNCQYRQQGPYLICYSCVLQHAVWIGMEKQMVGIDKNGQPILTKRGFKQG